MDIITDIILDRNVYFPGQNISGTLKLKNKNNIKLEKIDLVFIGRISNILSCENIITIVNNNITFYYNNFNNNFVNNIYFSNNILNSGSYKFNFIINIPPKNIPPNLDNKKCTVHYFIICEIYYYDNNKKNKLNIKNIKKITIFPKINVFNNKYLVPLKNTYKKNIYNYLINIGFIDYEVSMDYSAYMYNDHISLKFKFVNQTILSLENIYINLQLKRLILNTFENKIYENRIISNVKDVFNTKYITNINNREYYIFMIRSIFNESCITIFPEMTNNLFEVKYKIHITCKIETKCGKRIKLKKNIFDIIIGTLKNNNLIELPSY